MERVRNIVGQVQAVPVSSAAQADGQKFVVTLLGGGNSGHVCAGLIHENMNGRVITQLLTSRPEVWSKTPVVTFPDGKTQTGLIDKISNDPREVLPNADLILWTGPVNATKDVFENIQPFVNVERTTIGTIFAQGLVHILATRVFGSNVRFFALRNIPWLCRLTEKGSSSQIVGEKTSIEVAAINVKTDWIRTNVEPLFQVLKMGKQEPKINMMPDFCAIVFNPANQIIHPARYWGMFRQWAGQPLRGADEPSEWLYKGMDEVAGTALEVLDEELQTLKDMYFAATGFQGCESVVPLKERLITQYGDQIEDKSTMAKMVGTNKAYSAAKTPVIRTKLGVMPNPNHRVVVDDIGWGLCVLISIAERLQTMGMKVPTTMMRMMVEWHQDMMGKEYLVNGRLEGKDCADLVLLRKDDGLELVARPSSRNPSVWLNTVDKAAAGDRIGNP